VIVLSQAREIDAFNVVRDFEAAIAAYTGAPYCVTTTSCTAALLLAVAWQLRYQVGVLPGCPDDPRGREMWETCIPFMKPERPAIEIPKRTYVSVPMSIIHAGGRPTFRDEDWRGMYQLKPLPVWDSARWLTSAMYAYAAQQNAQAMACLSFHWKKTLGIQQGGAILHSNPEADAWLRRARFDGRTEGVAPSQDRFDMIGWHCYMSPETAAAGLVRLANLPKHNLPLANDEYPDLSLLAIFK